MKSIQPVFLGLLLAAAGAAADADLPLARVAAVQPPAWLVHEGARLALAPGTELAAGDALETGADGRLRIELGEGSALKLSAQAHFELPELRVIRSERPDGRFKAVLRVLKGAFRFTTGAIGAARDRQIGIGVGQVITAGIRGTDIFVKSDDEKDLLCLIDGRVEVAEGGESLVMDQPRTFYVVLRGQPPQKVLPVPAGKFDEWFPATDLRPQEPALYADGHWALGLIVYSSQLQADAQVRELSERGFPAQTRAVLIKGQRRFRVVVPGLRSRDEALRYVQVLKTRFGLRNARVLPPE